MQPTPVADEKQKYCLKLLIQGHVHSFTEFFQLVSYEKPVDPVLALTAPPELVVAQYEELAAQLSKAEIAQRQEDWASLSAAFRTLADGFAARGDFTRAVAFYEKCYPVAVKMNDTSLQNEVLLQLSRCCGKDGLQDYAKTVQHSTLRAELHRPAGSPRSQGAPEPLHLAALHQLFEDLATLAAYHEARNEMTAAFAAYSNCLKTAIVAQNQRLEGIACHHLGLVMRQEALMSGDERLRDQAAAHQQRYLDISVALGDGVAEAQACAALADCAKDRGQHQLAMELFQRENDIAGRLALPQAQAQASAALGAMWSGKGEAERSVACLEQSFKAATEAGNRKLADSIRVQIGIAKATARVVGGDKRASSISQQ